MMAQEKTEKQSRRTRTIFATRPVWAIKLPTVSCHAIGSCTANKFKERLESSERELIPENCCQFPTYHMRKKTVNLYPDALRYVLKEATALDSLFYNQT